MTCESLVHKLGRKGSWTTKELLDIATSHASGEEAFRAIFDSIEGKARWDKGAGEGTSNRSARRKKIRSNDTRTHSWLLRTVRVVGSPRRASEPL